MRGNFKFVFVFFFFNSVILWIIVLLYNIVWYPREYIVTLEHPHATSDHSLANISRLSARNRVRTTPTRSELLTNAWWSSRQPFFPPRLYASEYILRNIIQLFSTRKENLSDISLHVLSILLTDNLCYKTISTRWVRYLSKCLVPNWNTNSTI